MSIRFVKMEGLGNDYVYVDAYTAPELAQRADLPELARAISDRHRGVGSDGLILVARPEAPSAHVRMRMFNADGSESEMCGNGVRCVAKFAHDRLGLRKRPMLVQTGRGVLSIDFETHQHKLVSACVDMGEPELRPELVPVLESELVDGTGPERGLAVGSRVWSFVPVSMGNPHAVFFDHTLDLALLGPTIERHPAFPRRVNAHAVRVLRPDYAEMTTWERGAGLTQACGTGACAVLVAGVLTGRLQPGATIRLPGGELKIRWDRARNRVFMTGPAADVFEGTWPEPVRPRPVPTLHTARLLLRQLTHEDVPAIVAAMASPQISQNTLTIPHPYTTEQGHRWVAMTREGIDAGTVALWGIFLPASGELVGTTGLRINPDHDRAEVGYVIAEPHWGRGYATEALRAVLGASFGHYGLNRVEAKHFAHNPASGRVMAKAGMKPEGTLRQALKKNGRHLDDVVYAALRTEWTP